MYNFVEGFVFCMIADVFLSIANYFLQRAFYYRGLRKKNND